MVIETRSLAHYKPMPILFNEDNHLGFENNANNFSKTIKNYAGWECFDPGKGAGGTPDFGNYKVGYQLVPTNWRINTAGKNLTLNSSRKSLQVEGAYV